MTKRRDEERKRNKEIFLVVIGWSVTIIELLIAGMTGLLLLRSDMLPNSYLAIVAVVLIALIVVSRILMKRDIKKVRYCIGIILAAAMCVIMCIVSVYLNSLTNTLQIITDTTSESASASVYVRADDEAETINDAADYPFGIMDTLSRDDTDVAISLIEDVLSSELDITEYSGMVELADALLAGYCDAMIINSEFVDMMTDIEGYEDFDEQVKEIATYSWTEVSTSTEEVEEEYEEIDPINGDGIFTMYISGIDTWGGIATKSRSDVNILAVVNTNTHQVLLVSTPRDYYVELSISNGVKDKLTHAGIYGIDCSVDTMEMLYDTEIDYYFRINFSGFEALIDALGGITVTSEVAFEVEPDFSFVVGENELSGLEALAFARERYSFSDGDRQRGKNQMAVIEGVIEKLQTTAVLNNFSDLMDGLEGSFETDMSYTDLASLVKMQLQDGASWDVVSTSVDGTGSRQSTYSLSKSVYVMIPDEDTVDAAKELINAVLSGETVSVDE